MHLGFVHLLCALGASAIGCEHLDPRHPEPPTIEDVDPRTDPMPGDDGADDECARAARRLWALRCPLPGAEGASWVAFCRSRWPMIASDCIATRARRVDLPACGVACPEDAP